MIDRTELIMFGCYITGEDIETVSQMLNEWIGTPDDFDETYIPPADYGI